MTDLWRSSASDLAEAIRDKKVSAREVVDAHLARIAAVNPTVTMASATGSASRARGRSSSRSAR